MRLFSRPIKLANVVTVDLPHNADPTLRVGSVNSGRWMGSQLWLSSTIEEARAPVIVIPPKRFDQDGVTLPDGRPPWENVGRQRPRCANEFQAEPETN